MAWSILGDLVDVILFRGFMAWGNSGESGNLALASVPMAVFGVGGGLEKESAAMFSTAVSIIGLDMAIRSLAAKL
eukprot:gene18762-22410_t